MIWINSGLFLLNIWLAYQVARYAKTTNRRLAQLVRQIRSEMDNVQEFPETAGRLQ